MTSGHAAIRTDSLASATACEDIPQNAVRICGPLDIIGVQVLTDFRRAILS